MKKKILVLGGAGFIGNNLCTYLREKDYDVYCFDVNAPIGIATDHYICGDFFNDNELENAIDGMDYVIHSISTVNPGNSNESYLSGYEKDFIQSIKLCKMLLEKNIKLIFISSGGTVYGNHTIQPIEEDVLPHPINHYGNIKLSIENAMRAFNYQMKTKFLIARISNPYGKGQDFHKGVGFIDAVLKNTINNIPIEIWGDGENIRDYVYIQDVCDMLHALIEYEGEEDTFNISSSVGVSQNDIIDIVKDMGLQPQVFYKEKRSVDVRKIILNNSRIKSICDVEITDIKEGIKSYYEYLCLVDNE